jgi:hypothetical protein
MKKNISATATTTKVPDCTVARRNSFNTTALKQKDNSEVLA